MDNGSLYHRISVSGMIEKITGHLNARKSHHHKNLSPSKVPLPPNCQRFQNIKPQAKAKPSQG